MQVSNSELKYLASIADTVNSVLAGKSPISELTRIIETSLVHVVPDIRFHCYVGETTNDPYIMGVYPDRKDLEKSSAALLMHMEAGDLDKFMKEWQGIKNWIIEIDPKLLKKGSSICVDDGDQLVAILCHEIGHVLGGNAIALVRNYTNQKKMYSKAEQMLLSKNPLIRKFALPMFVHTAQFKLIVKNIGNNGLRDEVMADHYVPNEYREALVSYIEQHVLTNVTVARNAVATKEDFDSQQTVSIAFSRECIRLMRQRRDVLRNSIKAQYNKGNSLYMKNMVDDIGKTVMGYDPGKDELSPIYEGSVLRVLESNISDCEKEATRLLETTSVTPRDISILQVQADDISTVDQKLFVVHTIYDYLEALHTQNEKAAKKSSDGTKTNPIIDSQIDTLNEILAKVMKKDVSGVGDRYGIFIKYPKGYEG